MTPRINGVIAALTFATLTQGCAMLGATPNVAGGAGTVTSRAAPLPLAATAPSEKRQPPASSNTGTAGTPAQQALNAGIDAYNRGDYNLAIRRLGAAEIVTGDKALQLSALRYSAFSYCVSKRTVLCRQQFARALRLEPSFDLAPGERGHPLWGPVFEQAKKARNGNKP